MRLRDWAILVGSASAGMLAYGALVESNRLVLERKTLRLPHWPERLDGFKVAVLADFHLRGPYSLALAQRAVALALDQEPDFVVLPGDFVDYWRPGSAQMMTEALLPLLLMDGNVAAVPGNHDYCFRTDAERLRPVLEPLNIKLLRNEVWHHQGIDWVGIDSALENRADPVGTMSKRRHEPSIAIWHEPDLVGDLPAGCALQISGHSHGGQFRFPGGFTPMHSTLGKRYPRGYYPDAPTPLYVSRGIGTTGPPSRFLCPPEVSLLTLTSR